MPGHEPQKAVNSVRVAHYPIDNLCDSVLFDTNHFVHRFEHISLVVKISHYVRKVPAFFSPTHQFRVHSFILSY